MSAFINKLADAGQIVQACASLALVLKQAGLISLRAGGCVVSVLLAAYDITDTINNWARDPPMTDEVDAYILELKYV